jgi:hypothetical protein
VECAGGDLKLVSVSTVLNRRPSAQIASATFVARAASRLVTPSPAMINAIPTDLILVFMIILFIGS